jgi:hypothetical protein
MPKVRINLESSVPPGRLRSALLDFSADRPKLWPGIEPSLYEVYSVGETRAVVKEGSKMPGSLFWAVEEYDWSDPSKITWTVRESNFCAPGGSVSATIEARDGGGSRIEVVWNRTPTTFVGRMAAVLIVATRGRPVAASFTKAMKIQERLSVA